MGVIHIDSGVLIRVAIFAVALALFSAAEHWRPARAVPAQRMRVRVTNFAFGLAGALVGRWLGALLGAALLASWQWNQLGVLYWLWPSTSLWATALKVTVGLLALDAAIYYQHRLFHRWPMLWRWHAVHHSDAHLDASSALRFHPMEIAISWAWKMLVMIVSGAPVITLILFETLLNALALFNHANWRLQESTERRLEPWLITPAAHRRHHRDDAVDDAPNFGFSVPWWDQLAGTWIPALPIATLPAQVGVRSWPQAANARFLWLLRGK